MKLKSRIPLVPPEKFDRLLYHFQDCIILCKSFCLLYLSKFPESMCVKQNRINMEIFVKKTEQEHDQCGQYRL